MGAIPQLGRRKVEDYEVFPVEEVVKETPKAWLVLLGGVDDPLWMPKSQCSLTDDELWVPRWLAEAKELA